MMRPLVVLVSLLSAAAVAASVTAAAPPGYAAPTAGPPATGDFNGDGRDDQVLADADGTFADGSLVCSATFTLAGQEPKPVEFRITDVDVELPAVCPDIAAAADFAGTGTDMAVLQWNSSMQELVPARHAVTLTPAGKVGSIPVDPNAYFVAHDYRDLNGDGRSDVFAQEVDTSFPQYGYSITSPAGEVTDAPVNRCGTSKLVDIDASSPGVEVIATVRHSSCDLPGATPGVFVDRPATNTVAPAFTTPEGFSPKEVAFSDLNGDGTVHDITVQWRDISADIQQLIPATYTVDRNGRYTPTFEVPTAPTATADTVLLPKATAGKYPVQDQLLGNDSFSKPVFFSTLGNTTGALLLVDGDTLTLDTNGKAPKAGEFTYCITDLSFKTACATATVQLPKPDPGPAPIARNDRVYMTIGSHESGQINVRGNDLHADGTTVTITTQPTVGTATVMDNGRIDYRREGEGSRTGWLRYTLTDAHGRSSSAVLVVQMRHPNPWQHTWH